MTALSDLVLPHDSRPVLFVTNDFPPHLGGIQTYVRQLCDELPPDRVVVHAPVHPDAAAYDAELPFHVERDPARTLLPTPAATGRVQSTLLRHGASQVIYGASVPLGLMAPRLRRAGAVHQVALTHGHEVWWAALPITRQLLRRVADEVDSVTYVSEYTRRRIAPALSSSSRDKMVRLTPPTGPEFHPGVDGRAVRARLGIPRTAPVAICVARLVRRKGQDRLIRIWTQVLARMPDAHLVIVGGGPDAARLRRMVERRGLGTRVHLVGAVPSTPPYYAAADVFAMPVRNRFFGLEVEGLGISYLEAAASGLRVVRGSSGGAPEALPGRGTPD